MASFRLSRTRDGTRADRRAFTLVEMLVVVAIIGVLAGITLPMIVAANRKGKKTRIQADFQTIETALNAYRDEFGGYPQFPTFEADKLASTASPSVQGGWQWLDDPNQIPLRGAKLLCFALMSPGYANYAGSTSGTNIAGPGDDGADGPGFRTRRQFSGNVPVGKIHAPFLAPEKFKVRATQANFSDAVMLDSLGSPILYFPSLAPKPLLTTPYGYVGELTFSNFAGQPRPLYNGLDNFDPGTEYSPNKPAEGIPAVELEFLLGDRVTVDHMIGPGETALYTGPYILWSAGVDGVYGRDKSGRTDDVANFDFPVDLVK